MSEGTTTTRGLLDSATSEREAHDKNLEQSKERLRQWRADIVKKRDEMIEITAKELKEIDGFLGVEPEAMVSPAAAARRSKRARTAERQSTKTGEVSTGKPGPKPRADSKTTLVLQHVHKNDGAKTKEIAEALKLESAEVSKILNYHLGHNTVKSKGPRNDRQYSVTPAGRVLCKQFEKTAGA